MSRTPVEFPSLIGVDRVTMTVDQMVQTFQSVFKTKTSFIKTMNQYFTHRGFANGAPTFSDSRWENGTYRKATRNFWSDVLTYTSSNKLQETILNDFKAAVLYKTALIIAFIQYSAWEDSDENKDHKAPAALPKPVDVQRVSLDKYVQHLTSPESNTAWTNKYQVRQPIREVDDKGQVFYSFDITAGHQEVASKRAGFFRASAPKMLAMEIRERMKQLKEFDDKLDLASREFLACVQANVDPNFMPRFYDCFNAYAHAMSLTNVMATNLIQTLQQHAHVKMEDEPTIKKQEEHDASSAASQ
jgi:hypothetical protein